MQCTQWEAIFCVHLDVPTTKHSDQWLSRWKLLMNMIFENASMEGTHLINFSFKFIIILYHNYFDKYIIIHTDVCIAIWDENGNLQCTLQLYIFTQVMLNNFFFPDMIPFWYQLSELELFWVLLNSKISCRKHFSSNNFPKLEKFI